MVQMRDSKGTPMSGGTSSRRACEPSEEEQVEQTKGLMDSKVKVRMKVI